MEERIVQFIAALRASGVRVSLSESVDAFGAVDLMGVQDRETFRLSLRATLVKDAGEIPTFEELFPLFFDNAGPPPLLNLTQDLTPQEAEMLAQALRQFTQELRQMLDKLLRGEPFSQEELDRLGRLTGLHHVDNLRYRGWMARRLEQALGFQAVREATEELLELLAQLGMQRQRLEQMRRLVQTNQQALQEQLRRYAGQRIAENISQQPSEESIESLLHRPFGSLSDKDMERLRHEVRRLATALRSRVALRQKRAKTGRLDAKATIRANLKHGNIPIEIKYRDRSLKPKLVIICDVSTSMRHCSELMLSLIYAMQGQISKTRAFAFIDHLEYISPDFVGKEAREAVSQVLRRLPSGYYNTDLGHSLENFVHDFMDTVDNRTTFIIVGDGRNNYNNPQIDLFRTIARRSHRTLWFNPESPIRWGTGDSDMLQYSPLCDVVLQVSTLAELTAAVDRLLSHP
ncbi:MAG: VWA domain-containing protein [Anaerolineae bacterium]